MDIRTTVAGDALRGSLDDPATARDFAALLPLTFRWGDFAVTEKIVDLPHRLARHPGHHEQPPDLLDSQPRPDRTVRSPDGPHPAK